MRIFELKGCPAPALLLAAMISILLPGSIRAQDVPVFSGQPVMRNGGVVKQASPGSRPGTPNQPGKPDEKKDGDTKGDGKDEKKDKSDEGGLKPVKRGDKPLMSGDSQRSKLVVDADGRVTLNWVGAPWPDVLQQLADAAKKSLDWQELPGDYLNLTTHRSYTLDEVRNQLNRHLLDRGFTILSSGETMTVVKLDSLNPAIVPRVAPEELAERDQFEFVRVSFRLEWLVAEKQVEELKPMLSKFGKLTHLSATNRIEGIDTAGNLLEVHRMLQSEQSDEGQDRLVQVFQLNYRRAEEVVDLVKELMGLQRSGSFGNDSGGMQVQLMQQMVRHLQTISSNGKNVGGKDDGAEIKLVANTRQNSIVAKAPPDKMAEIEQAVKALDVPGTTAESILQNVNRMKVYRLESFDPQPLVQLLNELGDLDPRTQLKVDTSNKSIIAYATLADHLTISTLVEKLDSSHRRFEVMQLRRLQAEYVAGTIRGLMSADESDKNQNSSGRYYFRSYGMPEENKETRKFKVDADIENNRLLLFASDVEMDEVRNLLIKLGEIPAEGTRDANMRLINIPEQGDAARVIEQLRQMWTRPNQIHINLPQREPEPVPVEPTRPDNSATNDGTTRAAPPPQSTTAVRTATAQTLQRKHRHTPSQSRERRPRMQLTGLPGVPTDAAGQHGALPPVNITLTPDGRIMVTSDDTDALNQIEDLLSQLTPSRGEFNVYTLEYASPTWVTLTLREFFEKQDGKKPILDWWGEIVETDKDSGNSLSKKRMPKFIADTYTSTIVVLGADQHQLRVIEELIQLYDQPEPEESRSMRVTQTFPLRFADANVVADAIKDVYRELLSAKDKAFQNNGNKEQQPTGDRVVYNYIRGGTGDDNAKEEAPVKFDGQLSVGVDPTSNTIIVSAVKGLLDNIGQLVEELDTLAAPASNVQVIQVGRDLDTNLLQQRLNQIFGPKPKSEGQQQNQQQPGQGPGNGNQANRRRGNASVN